MRKLHARFPLHPLIPISFAVYAGIFAFLHVYSCSDCDLMLSTRLTPSSHSQVTKAFSLHENLLISAKWLDRVPNNSVIYTSDWTWTNVAAANTICTIQISTYPFYAGFSRNDAEWNWSASAHQRSKANPSAHDDVSQDDSCWRACNDSAEWASRLHGRHITNLPLYESVKPELTNGLNQWA